MTVATARARRTITPPAFATMRADACLVEPPELRDVMLAAVDALERQWEALSEYSHQRAVAAAMARMQGRVTSITAALARLKDAGGPPARSVRDLITGVQRAHVRAVAERARAALAAERNRRAAHAG